MESLKNWNATKEDYMKDIQLLTQQEKEQYEKVYNDYKIQKHTGGGMHSLSELDAETYIMREALRVVSLGRRMTGGDPTKSYITQERFNEITEKINNYKPPEAIRYSWKDSLKTFTWEKLWELINAPNIHLDPTVVSVYYDKCIKLPFDIYIIKFKAKYENMRYAKYVLAKVFRNNINKPDGIHFHHYIKTIDLL